MKNMPKISKNKGWCFLDRDGVLVKDTRPYKIEDMEILQGVVEGLQRLQSIGFEFIIVTSQAGIAKGYYTLEDAEKFNEELTKRLASKNIAIKKIYLCPHHPDFTGECECRKPKTGLAKQAAKEFGINLRESYFVGDKDPDTEFGKNCGGKTFRIVTNDYPNEVKADYEANNLVEVAEILEKLN